VTRTVGNNSKNLFLLDAAGRFEVESDFGFSIKKDETNNHSYVCTAQFDDDDNNFKAGDVYFGSQGIRIKD